MTVQTRSQLLVSVRSASEAMTAWRGGADLIDIKEPNYGPLGKARNDAIVEVVQRVANRKPISAAFGELRTFNDIQIPSGLQFIKFGLANCAAGFDWRMRLADWQEHPAIRQDSTVVVNVAYADWGLARAPRLEEVLDYACLEAGGVFLIDTWRKLPGRNLLNLLGKNDLFRIAERCRSHDVRIGLAGSLGLSQIDNLLEVAPDWFAVRGAVCGSGRQSSIDENKVRELSSMLENADYEIIRDQELEQKNKQARR